MNKTLDYYNDNAKSFIEATREVVFSDKQDTFLSHLPAHASILDFGCGSGRDTAYFLKKGYQVEAVDGSIEMCKAASLYTGIEVKHMLFSELDAENKYDGIWACSSILHLPKQELADVLKCMARALKVNGVIYTSFKYGTFEGERNGRFFTDFTEEAFRSFLSDHSQLEIVNCWLTEDARPDRKEERWLNVLLKNRRTKSIVE